MFDSSLSLKVDIQCVLSKSSWLNYYSLAPAPSLSYHHVLPHLCNSSQLPSATPVPLVYTHTAARDLFKNTRYHHFSASKLSDDALPISLKTKQKSHSVESSTWYVSDYSTISDFTASAHRTSFPTRPGLHAMPRMREQNPLNIRLMQ